MYTPIINGVDPGIVHTGIVSLTFDVGERELDVGFHVVDGTDAVAARIALQNLTDCEEPDGDLEKSHNGSQVPEAS